ncbi:MULTISPECIES: hypothetical protein [unclassified Coleofasciculus]|uniref:hypothetical protein n=1 Tax=unclassified Coleofasciculus TaxID=2692782 RepID=UPI001881F1ED|nr:MULTISPECIES: hypothetical protein [unclassified Coleofasciculus]MBE9125955.1 hypothetical protein [Coleofasciculus sp. LEGE 07081]MBE9148849.1 hypothetical protein [Coleofasciculus sp. LEGE 07092]
MDLLHDPTRITDKQLEGLDTITLNHWEKDIYNRFRESKKRFPEFFPCFKLKNHPVAGLCYSIHFQPLTQHAQALIGNAPRFPHQEEFKPIEKLWNEFGQSELDILFEHFPTQLALKPPKPEWWKVFLGLISARADKRKCNILCR